MPIKFTSRPDYLYYVVMDNNGEIYGILEASPNEDVTALLRQMILDSNPGFDEVKLPENAALVKSGFTAIEATLTNEAIIAKKIIEVSLTAADIYRETEVESVHQP